MNRQILSSGTIVCSAVVLSGWVHPSSSNATNLAAEASSASDRIPTRKIQSEKHRSPAIAIARIGNLPERFLGLQWGNRPANRLPDTMEAVYSDLLKQAQTLASQEKYAQAIEGMNGIPKNSQHYEMAQRLQEDWSRELLRQASEQYQQARLTTAIAWLKVIPASSSAYHRATEMTQRWSQEARLIHRAIAARNARDWQQTINTLQSLEGRPLYHSLPVQALLQQAMMQRYQPDQTLLDIATADLPTMNPSIAPPEAIPVNPGR